MPQTILSIEGNIGSGKSTLVSHLSNIMGKIVIFLQEPVDEWKTIKDIKGETMLEKFYKNQTNYAFAFQMMAFISRLALLKKTLMENPDAIIITERCLNTDREVFAKMLYDSGKIEEVEYLIYLRWFDTFTAEFPISKYIYLKTTPEISHTRMLSRNRKGETISIEYLRECHLYHENWLTSSTIASQVITIDATGDKDNIEMWGKKVIELLLS